MASTSAKAAFQASKDITIPKHLRSNWSTRAPELLKEGMKAKFSQNAALKEVRLATGDTTVVEVSLDKLWGCGRRLEDPLICGG